MPSLVPFTSCYKNEKALRDAVAFMGGAFPYLPPSPKGASKSEKRIWRFLKGQFQKDLRTIAQLAIQLSFKQEAQRAENDSDDSEDSSSSSSDEEEEEEVSTSSSSSSSSDDSEDEEEEEESESEEEKKSKGKRKAKQTKKAPPAKKRKTATRTRK